eukprot:scaffold99475_cov72-Phaeocystis_antarctica.AAC.4
MRLSTASESEMMALVGYHTRIGSVESSAPEPVLFTLTDTSAPLVSAPLSARVHPDVPTERCRHVGRACCRAAVHRDHAHAALDRTAGECGSVDNIRHIGVHHVAHGHKLFHRQLPAGLIAAASVVDLCRSILHKQEVALVEELQSRQRDCAALRVVLRRIRLYAECCSEQQHGCASHVSERGASLGPDHCNTQRACRVVLVGRRGGKQAAAAERHERQRTCVPSEPERPRLQRKSCARVGVCRDGYAEHVISEARRMR